MNSGKVQLSVPHGVMERLSLREAELKAALIARPGVDPWSRTQIQLGQRVKDAAILTARAHLLHADALAPRAVGAPPRLHYALRPLRSELSGLVSASGAPVTIFTEYDQGLNEVYREARTLEGGDVRPHLNLARYALDFLLQFAVGRRSRSALDWPITVPVEQSNRLHFASQQVGLLLELPDSILGTPLTTEVRA